MQDLSYAFPTAALQFWMWQADVMLYTFENAYGLDPNAVTIQTAADEIHIICTRLLYAGGQMNVPGRVDIKARRQGKAVLVDVYASHPEQNIRSVKLTVHGLPDSTWINKLDLTKPKITADGINAHYPEGWRTIDTPMVVLEHPNHTMTCLRSLDKRVRDKRFVMRKTANGIDVEMIFEAYGAEIATDIAAPTWEMRSVASLEEAYRLQQEHIADVYHLVPWEQRPDVPSWARSISLVTAIHGQHWTGYVMNDYGKMLHTIEWFAKRMDGRRILAFLPGWEGRYYWQYGDYRPCPRMGGENGFARLCDGAREMGVHLMPMFGINVVNRCLPGYEQWGSVCEVRNVNGLSGHGSVDWDGSRHYDHGSNACLNPGAPMWQKRLAGQIVALAKRYGFQAAFLDIAACWYNDPHFPPTSEGVKALCDLLRAGVEDMLVAGEGWYDGLSSAMPVIHSGHTDGPMHYHDALYAPFFDTYMREFAHLCLGDPGHGSTGVHELGTNTVEWRVPVRKGLWQTVTIVEDTLEKAPDKVEEIIRDAKEYTRLYLREGGV